MKEESENWVRLVQAGEIQYYEHIVRAYQKQILIYCWRLLGSRQEAEDAVQDILVRAFEKIGMYKPAASFSSWLYKIAYHHCLNVIRRKKMQQMLSFSLLIPGGGTEEDAAQQMENRLFSEPLSKALDKLTAEERNLLVLRVFEEKSFQEIGEILNKNDEAVKKKYNRTRAKLKTILEHQGEEEKCAQYKALSKTKA